MKTISSLLLVFGLFLLGGSQITWAGLSLITISDNGTGGDCNTVGIWNSGSKTCTLTENLISKHVVIEDSNITLHCDGYMIQGEQTRCKRWFYR